MRMTILSTPGFADYELLDSGDGKRLERYAQYVISRPDPSALWEKGLQEADWQNVDASFENDKWIHKKPMPDKWKVRYKDLSFWARLTPFKHTGIFPEQHLQWDFISNNTKPESNILNLFGYTGIASLTAAVSGGKVTHVDASKPAISWTHENQELSGLEDKPIRWIVDDATTFVRREIKRGVKYDGIIMDPPVYGHGPKGETWDFMKDFPKLLEVCGQVLSDSPQFVLINAYAVSASSILLENMLQDTMKMFSGIVEAGELALQEKHRKRLLSTGIFARWHN